MDESTRKSSKLLVAAIAGMAATVGLVAVKGLVSLCGRVCGKLQKSCCRTREKS